MSSWLPALLCLDSLPKPSLWAKLGQVIPVGTRVTIWCQGPPRARLYRLEKQGSDWNAVSFPKRNKASFPLGEMVTAAAGFYGCRYWSSSGWSEPSDPLVLIVTGQYAKPILSAMPSSVVAPGETVTLHCQSSHGLDGFMMSKDQVDKATTLYAKTLANFSIRDVTAAHGGTYRCYTFDSSFPYVWSAPSEPLVLRVTDPPEEHSLPGTWEPEPPSYAAPQDITVGNLVRLSLAGLVLIILGVLLAEAWLSQRGQ